MTGYIPPEEYKKYFAEVSKAGAQKAKEFFSDAYSSTYVRLPAHMWDHLADQFEQAMIEEFQVSGPINVAEEIPADVMQQAREIAGPECKCIDGCGLCKDDRIETIARAILAERERCAKVAENWMADLQPMEIIDNAVYRLAERIREGR